ncbi:hypothetical protein F4779DRAFT_635519 [Xylariaceae sp. FL0662B]|nr:hypothetical protein F4779DRAFT_635519 [Xylariaceae sp. FL0662B]
MFLLLPLVSLGWISITIARDVSVRRANAGCGFRLSTEGGFNGPVGQLPGGQARAGTDMSPSLLTWFGDAFVDQQGRGCWWTPPTMCLQCDMYQQPDHGFGIGCSGEVSYNSQSTFYECQTGDGDQVDIYLEPSGANCSTITLRADSCRPPCAAGASSSPPPTPSSSPPPAPSSQTPPTTPTTTTATSVPQQPTSPTTSPPPPGECAFVVAHGPSEIILIDRGNPGAAYGANAAMAVQVTPNATSLFNFGLARADAGKECALVFSLPSSSPLPSPSPATGNNPPPPPPPYNLTASGGVASVAFALLDGPAGPDTTFDSAPRVAMPLAAVAVGSSSSSSLGGGAGGVRSTLLRFPCPGLDAPVAFAMAEPPGGDTCLEYVQDDREVMGLFLVTC